MKNKILFLISIFFLFSIISNISAFDNKKCGDIYFLVLQTNYNYTSNQLQTLNVTDEEIYSYQNECENYQYPLLPEIYAPPMLIKPVEQAYCEYSHKSAFWVAFPFFKMPVKWNCKSIEFWKYFLSFEENEGEYAINGIVVFPVLVLMLILFFVLFISFASLKPEFERGGEDDKKD